MLSLLTLMIWINMTQNPNSQKFYCPVMKNGKKNWERETTFSLSLLW